MSERPKRPMGGSMDCWRQLHAYERYADEMDAWLAERDAEILAVLREFADMVCVCHKSYVDRGLEDPTCDYHNWKWAVDKARELVAELEDSHE